MGEIIDFKPKESEQLDGAILKTLSSDTLINIFFPGVVDWETIVIQTTIENVCNVIKSEVHQHAVWHALGQFDEMRKMYPGTAGTGGKFGTPERLVDVQLGLVNPES